MKLKKKSGKEYEYCQYSYSLPGRGCSKLTMSLVNISLKFQTLISNIR